MMAPTASVLLVLAVAVAAASAGPCNDDLTTSSPTFTFSGITGAGSFKAGDFNVISFAGVTGTTGDVEGRVLAQEKVSLGGGFSIGDKIDTSARPPVDHPVSASLVANSIEWISGSLEPNGEGYICASDDCDLPAHLPNARVGGACDGCLAPVFNTLSTYYNDFVSTYSAMKANTISYVKYGGLFIAGVACKRYVLKIDAATFNSVRWYSTKGVNPNKEFVFIISGGDVTFSGDNFPGVAEKVIYVIQGDVKVNVNTEVVGSIIAPEATFSQTGGVVQGFVVVADVENVLQVNKPTCGGCDCCSVCGKEQPFDRYVLTKLVDQ